MPPQKFLEKKTITIKRITTATKNGDTSFYITDENNNKYIASIKLSDKLPFISAGEKLEIAYYNKNEEVVNIVKVY